MEDLRRDMRSTRQVELIRRYCEEADSRLSGATDYASALRVKDSLCDRFERECDSGIVILATKRFIDDLLRARWGGESREPGATLGKH